MVVVEVYRDLMMFGKNREALRLAKEKKAAYDQALMDRTKWSELENNIECSSGRAGELWSLKLLARKHAKEHSFKII